MKGFEDFLRELSFFDDLRPEHLGFMASCCKNQVFEPGELIGQEGEDADYFYVIREGKAAVQIFAPNKGAITLETLSDGDIIGWSWLFPPYKWNFDIKAIKKTRTIAMDGKCLRQKCEDNHELGYLLMKKFSKIMIHRLKATRLQVLDIYAANPPASHAAY